MTMTFAVLGLRHGLQRAHQPARAGQRAHARRSSRRSPSGWSRWRLIVLAAELPALQKGLLTAPMSGRQWFACVGLALLLPMVVEGRKWILRRRAPAPEALDVRRAVAPGHAA